VAKRMRVLIVDDHTIVRDGLKAILESQPDIEVVGEATEGKEALEKAERLKPDLTIMDLTMPGMSGLEATKQLKLRHPSIKVIVLTMHESDDYFFQVLHAGADGYFVKGGSSSELLSALRTVWQGEVFLYPSMAKKLLHDYLKPGRGAREPYEGQLTERELEVMKLVAQDMSNQEIADLLVLSVSTVQTHRAHIMSKLGLHSRTELVKYAIRRGIISLEA